MKAVFRNSTTLGTGHEFPAGEQQVDEQHRAALEALAESDPGLVIILPDPIEAPVSRADQVQKSKRLEPSPSSSQEDPA